MPRARPTPRPARGALLVLRTDVECRGVAVSRAVTNDDRSAAHGAILDLLLRLDRQVERDLDWLPAVRAGDRLELNHARAAGAASSSGPSRRCKRREHRACA